MSDDDGDDTAGVPNSDPRHLDPAGDIADAVERGDIAMSPDTDTDAETLREFIDLVERGDLEGPVTPNIEATVRIARAMLERYDAGDGGGDSGE